ncbi:MULTISPECIES: LytR/AlgR family response regulator transcription factor [Spirosoma]|uniref:Response regulator transcription factor n=1 Tax=Spirosoma sordidisoli TaxID=2502893 RepID=A0A4Q2UIM3_9BACT|nr:MULTISPECIES: LytTR family DNA-binding domain-containing protein [Spirosoma]RYC68422.1 response regulator transcription factor [Spirosoma sordidisoli]
MFSCLIVEDDPSFSDQLTTYLAKTTLFDAPLICRTAREAFSLLNTIPINLVLLDYDLPDMNGLDLLACLPQPPQVVMTTAHTQPAVACFDIDAVADFLTKPYSYPRFLRAVRRALGNQLQPAESQPASKAPAAREDKYIYFKSGRKLNRFVLDDIVYAEAYGAYTKVHTLTGSVAINQRLATLQNELPRNRFLRVHKSFIINSLHLSNLETNRLHVLSYKIPIGITYRPAVLQFMQQAGITAPIS